MAKQIQRKITRSPPPAGHHLVPSLAPIFHEGKSKFPTSVLGVHYTPIHGLTHLDPAEAGTGSAGRERRRYGMGNFGRNGDPMSRMTHFYVQTGKNLPKKEHVVAGGHAYHVVLNNMYDIKADPEGIFKHADEEGYGSNSDRIIEDIHSKGYDGFVSAHRMPGSPSLTASVIGVKGKIPVHQIK